MNQVLSWIRKLGFAIQDPETIDEIPDSTRVIIEHNGIVLRQDVSLDSEKPVLVEKKFETHGVGIRLMSGLRCQFCSDRSPYVDKQTVEVYTLLGFRQTQLNCCDVCVSEINEKAKKVLSEKAPELITAREI